MKSKYLKTQYSSKDTQEPPPLPTAQHKLKKFEMKNMRNEKTHWP